MVAVKQQESFAMRAVRIMTRRRSAYSGSLSAARGAMPSRSPTSATASSATLYCSRSGASPSSASATGCVWVRSTCNYHGYRRMAYPYSWSGKHGWLGKNPRFFPESCTARH